MSELRQKNDKAELLPGPAGTSPALEESPQLVPQAPVAEVMREQLDYLLDHVSPGLCGCAECQRYQRVRAILLEVFRDRRPAAGAQRS